MKKAQRKNVVVEPLAESKPGVCPKCADRHKVWSVSFCGPEQRLSSCLETTRVHTLGDSSEHLLFACARCGFMVATVCADAK